MQSQVFFGCGLIIFFRIINSHVLFIKYSYLHFVLNVTLCLLQDISADTMVHLCEYPSLNRLPPNCCGQYELDPIILTIIPFFFFLGIRLINANL